MKIFCFFILFILPWCSRGQGHFTLTEEKPLSFKFELINHLVLVPVTINGIEFTFLMDSGVEETILFAYTQDSLLLHNRRKVKFQGIGMGEGFEGILSNGNVVNVGGVAVDSLHGLYVVQAEDLDLSSRVGVGINGILGSRFFKSFPLKIDYIRSKITIYPLDFDYSQVVKNFVEIPIKLHFFRPYVESSMQIGDKWIEGKLLLDMGNTDAFMLFGFLLPEFTVHEPYVEEFIGQGFNGAIYGKRNRIRRVSVQGIVFDFPIVAYPDSNSVYMAKFIDGRIGSIGNQSLQRFHILMDYQNERIFVRKNGWFGKPFSLNMAGMGVKHEGLIWTMALTSVPKAKAQQQGFFGEELGVTLYPVSDKFQYTFVLKPNYVIEGLREGSPAVIAGVAEGDRLLMINGIRAENLTLAKILSKFQTNPGDLIRLQLQRGDKKIRVRFRLVDPVPFHKNM